MNSNKSNKRPRLDRDAHIPDGFLTTKPSSSKPAKSAVQVPQFTSAFDSDAPPARSRGSSRTAQNVHASDIGQGSSTQAAGSSTRPVSVSASGTGAKVTKEKKLVSMSVQNPQNQFTLEKRAAEKPTSSASSKPPQLPLRASVPPRAIQHLQPPSGVASTSKSKAEGGSSPLKPLPAPAFPVSNDKHASIVSLKPLPVPKPPSKQNKPALFHVQAPPLPKAVITSAANDVQARAPVSAFLPKQEEPEGSSQDAGGVFDIPARNERDRERTAPPHQHPHRQPELKLMSFGSGGESGSTDAGRGLELSPEKKGKGNASKFIRGGLAVRAAEHFSSTHTSLVLWHKSLSGSTSTSNSRLAPLPPADLTARIVKVLHLPMSDRHDNRKKSAHVAPGIALCHISFPGSGSSAGSAAYTSKWKGKAKDDSVSLETRIRPDCVYRVVFSFPPASLSPTTTRQEDLFVEGAVVRVYRPWTTLVVLPLSLPVTAMSTSSLARHDGDGLEAHHPQVDAGGHSDDAQDKGADKVKYKERDGDSDMYMHSRVGTHLQPFPEMPLSLPTSSLPPLPGTEAGRMILDGNHTGKAGRDLVGDVTLFCTRFLVML